MKKLLICSLCLLCSVQSYASSSVDKVYVSATLTEGVYKMNGNEQYDGHFPTTELMGLGLNAGLTSRLNRSFYLLNEIGYNFGYRQNPAANYSSLMFRIGIEMNPDGNSFVAPYLTIGGGIVALDPEKAYIQMDFGYEFQGGVKVKLDDCWNLIAGASFTETDLNYSEKIETTTFQRFNGFIGIERKF